MLVFNPVFLYFSCHNLRFVLQIKNDLVEVKDTLWAVFPSCLSLPSPVPLLLVSDSSSQGKWLGHGFWRPMPGCVVMPDVRIPEQEERRLPRQCNSQKGKFITDSSQGLCRNQHSGAGSESPEPKLLQKFIGWAHAVGSWFKQIGYKFAKQFHWSKLLHAGLSQGLLPRS